MSNQQGEIKDEIEKLLIKYEEKLAVDEGYDLNKTYCPADKDLLKEIMQVIESKLLQERQNTIEEIKNMKAVPAKDVQDQEYEDNYVYNRNSVIEEIVDNLLQSLDKHKEGKRG